MPATNARNQGKTLFVEAVLSKNPYANTRAVNQAWRAAGRQGTISETLVNKLRSRMGLAGNLRGKRPETSATAAGTTRTYSGKKRGRKPKQEAIRLAEGNPAQPGAAASRPNDRLINLEADLDRLLFRVMNIGGLAAVENALREARRRLYDAFVAIR